MLTQCAAGHPVLSLMHRPGKEKRGVVMLESGDWEAWPPRPMNRSSCRRWAYCGQALRSQRRRSSCRPSSCRHCARRPDAQQIPKTKARYAGFFWCPVRRRFWRRFPGICAVSRGGLRSAIERRPLLLVDQHLTRCRHLTQCGALRIFNILSFMPHWHKPLLGRLNLGAAGASLCAPDVCPPCISTKRAKAASGPPQKRSPPAVLRACECLRRAGTGKKKSGALFRACL